ncbi:MULTISPECIES: endonuclease domain-containing protein [Glycomyces]|uniref:Endonuclease domain-containing protein n=1 Tax=Glycomyces lechevalierae TaxID=256034 RepID=A0A9X3PIK1_9ACTN|nr:endonuclease domain-containing protein [Glycomyces lechevalierae]MDA1384348.1 endonuclease domain-containing protein [Glycomyces lechevalierae]MDR7339219.1 hypothetical protein [Glycomyces lechevalierae]
MPYDQFYDLVVGETTHEKVRVIVDYATGKGRSKALGRDAFIELPVVVQLLQALKEGTVSAAEASGVLEELAREVAPEPGLFDGCCSSCAHGYEGYLRAWDDFDRYFANQELLEQSRMDYDIVVTKNRIHAADCGAARIHLPSPPSRLADYTHGGYLGDRPGPYVLLMFGELDGWIIRNTAKSGRRKFCKLCIARVPGALAREANATPACWEWPGQSLGNLEPDSYEAFKTIATWQDGRCAVCGVYADLVLDHNHGNGLVRGWICRSCNSREGSPHDNSEVMKNFRTRNPASILGIRISFFLVKDHQLRESKKIHRNREDS